MNLAQVYQGVAIGNFGGFPEDSFKNAFGRRGVKFCKEAAKVANAAIAKRYPFYNKGGIAVLGEVYCNIAKPDSDWILEICLSESGPYYRTNNGKGGYSPNIWIGGYGIGRDLKDFTTESLAGVIRKFLDGAG